MKTIIKLNMQDFRYCFGKTGNRQSHRSNILFTGGFVLRCRDFRRPTRFRFRATFKGKLWTSA